MRPIILANLLFKSEGCNSLAKKNFYSKHYSRAIIHSMYWSKPHRWDYITIKAYKYYSLEIWKIDSETGFSIIICPMIFFGFTRLKLKAVIICFCKASQFTFWFWRKIVSIALASTVNELLAFNGRFIKIPLTSSFATISNFQGQKTGISVSIIVFNFHFWQIAVESVLFGHSWNNKGI